MVKTIQNRLNKNNDENGKALYKLINNAIYGKPIENLRCTINVKLVNIEKDYLKRTSKASFMSHKKYDSNQLQYIKGSLH